MQATENVTLKPSRQKEIWQDRVFNAVIAILVALVLLMTLYPLYLVLICSVSDATLVTTGRVTLYPKGFTLTGYNAVFQNKEIWRSYMNSIIYTVTGTVLSLMVTMGAAFTLSRKFPGKRLISFLFAFTMFFNGGMIPTYLVIRDLGLLDSRVAVLLPGLVSVFNFINMRTHFESLPAELEESAKLDGANHWTIFTRVILPISGATMAVMVLFYGVTHWNSWFLEMLYLPNSRDLWPLALITREIILSSSNAAMSDGAVMTQEMADAIKYATIIVTTLPILCLYPFLQKYFAKGVTVGAVKG